MSDDAQTQEAMDPQTGEVIEPEVVMPEERNHLVHHVQALAPSADLLMDPASFEHAQRVAKVFASSVLVPQHLRGKVADCLLALAMARRLNEDPLVVMQSIYVVSGKAGWSAQYMIARANRSGIFSSRINWRVKGKGDDLEVTAFAKLADSSEEVSVAASMAMAKAESWTKNDKYRSMPEHMLRWRSATMLIRLFAPEVMLGFSTVDEIQDVTAAHGGGAQASQVGSNGSGRLRDALGLGKPENPFGVDEG
jgi:hypothetical protein